MNIWIDVLTTAGERLGDGPITTATDWQSVRRLDADTITQDFDPC